MRIIIEISQTEYLSVKKWPLKFIEFVLKDELNHLKRLGVSDCLTTRVHLKIIKKKL